MGELSSIRITHIFEVLVDVCLDPVVNQKIPLAVIYREGSARPPILQYQHTHFCSLITIFNVLFNG